MAQGNNTKTAIAALVESRRNEILRNRETFVKRGVLNSLVSNELVEEAPEERLASLESVARAAWDAGEKNMHDWYTALTKIRDEKLYQPQHRSFESYLRANWYDRVSRTRVWQLINMQRVVDVFSEPETSYPALQGPENKTVHIVDNFENEILTTERPVVAPKTEAQARELAPLLRDPEAVKSTWKKAQEESGLEQPPASAIRSVIGRNNGPVTTKVVDIPPVPVISQPVDEVTRLRAALLKHHIGWQSNDPICTTCGESR